MLADAAALAAAFWAAFLLRFEGVIPAPFAEVLLLYLPWVIGIKLVVLGATRRYKATWRYTNLREVASVFNRLAVVTLMVFAWLALRRLLPNVPEPYVRGVLPVGVILLDLVLSFLALVAVRVAVRILNEHRQRRAIARTGADRVPTLLIGAGSAGVQVAKAVLGRPDSGLQLMGFVDDDDALRGLSVDGLPVLGNTAELSLIARRCNVRQAIISIANASDRAIRRIAQLCASAGLITKVIPPLHEIVEGHVSLSKLREVSIEDLLRRRPVNLGCREIETLVRDRPVLVTGAGGSIGSELCRLVAGLGPSRLILVEQAENNLFSIHGALLEAFPGLIAVPCIADIGDESRMDAVFAEYRPSLVFHAAAHKHVPMMEWNPGEAVKNNILGTRTVATLAGAWNVERFVMISTDKAVNPTSVMGVSKRSAELFIQAFAQNSRTRFMTVRFGNVLGSAGSVIPIFKRQIAQGGPLTVTHPDMRRYFMTIPEACQLVIQAAAMGRGGELFILDMGEPVKIVDLARDLIRLSGLEPDEDIEIRFTGLRPGEKLFEELSLGEEDALKTSHPRIYIGRVKAANLAWINGRIDELGVLAMGQDVRPVFGKLKELVPEYDCQVLRPDVVATASVQGPHAQELRAVT